MTELPICRWRRQPVGPDRHVCISNRVRCNAAGIADSQCFTCLHRDHPLPDPPRWQCRHLGPLRRVAPVALLHRTDGACVTTRIHACAVHGECSPNTANIRIPNCLTCPDHSPDFHRAAAGDVRHLMYFLWPHGPLWRWNVAQLLQRLSLFNGRRLVSIAIGHGSVERDEAAAAFAGQGVELVFYANDPCGREKVAHQPMLEVLSQYRSDRDVTFYGHGKGASSHLYGDGVRRWAQAMYELLLDYWPVVRHELADHAAVGVFRRLLSPAPAAHVAWHYSGSFRWTRNRDLYSRNWRAEDPSWVAPETYPGRHLSLAESSCLAGEFAYGGAALYVVPTWEAWGQAAVDEFKAAHTAELEVPMVVTIILTAHAQRERVHDAVASVQAQTNDSWQLIVMYSGRIDAADLVERYRDDARVRLEPTGEDEEGSPDRCGQGWAINEAWRRGLVRGELVIHLSDDDLLAPTTVAKWIQVAGLQPEWGAWYGLAQRQRIHQDGRCEDLSPLELRGVGRLYNPLRTHVDGLQVCCRRSARTDWPEDLAVAGEADGVWLDTLGMRHHLHPVDHVVGIHRHTPESCFTR
jgi:hypothetical protein